MDKVLIINGPNLNMLGSRQPDIYGSVDFETFLGQLKVACKNIEIAYFQSNSESEIIGKLQASDKDLMGIILNAGAYTHTSIAIADAVQALRVPVVEVHISNVFARESFRHVSYIAPYCKGVIAGFGLDSYRLAIESLKGAEH